MLSSDLKEKLRQKIGLSVGFSKASIPGVFTIEAQWELLGTPIGVVWYRWVGNARIEVLNSYVPELYRRLGIRTFLHDKLIEHNPSCKEIVTMSHTPLSRPWLKRVGFVRNEHKDWIYKVP